MSNSSRLNSSSSTLDRPLVMIIDDEPAIAESLAYCLEGAGFDSIAVDTLAGATQKYEEARLTISLIILDLSLPDGHGFDWLRQLRSHSQLPVVILSSHDDEIEHIVGLEIGADDFIDKPFSPREVVARVRAILRRTTAQAPYHSIPQESDNSHSEFPQLKEIKPQLDEKQDQQTQIIIDYSQYKVFIDQKHLGLSQLEFSLLETLFLAQRVLTRSQLLQQAWEGGGSVSERTVDVHIKAIRKKWSKHRKEELIETIRGVGYRLSENIPPIMTRGQPIK